MKFQNRLARSCALLALLASSSSLEGQPSVPLAGPMPTSLQAQDADDSVYLRRVLRLRNGSFVRTACSFRDGAWELGKKASAKSIPDAYVEQVTLEKTLLRELKKRIKAGAPGTLPAWCLQRGLLKEGLAQLDKDLGSHALHASALETLKDFERFLPSPPSVDESHTPEDIFAEHAHWLASKNTASLHQLAAHSLAQAARTQSHTLTPEQVAPWDRCLTGVLTGNKSQQRDLALSALAQWKSTGGAKTLRRFAMLDRNEGTRQHAAWLLGSLQDPSQVSGLIAWMQHEHAEIRMRAASALGFSGYPAAVPALITALGSGASSTTNRIPHANIFIGSQTAYVQDFDVEVANRSSVADPVINVLPTGVVLDVGVSSIAIHRQRTVYRKALNRITGHRAGNSAKAWTQWLGAYSTVQVDWRAPWPAPQ